MRRTFLWSTIICIFFIDMVSANIPNEIVSTGKQKVFTTSELTYYGLDFSQMKLVNPYKLGTGDKILHTYVPVWVDQFDESYPEKRLNSLFSVDVFKYNNQLFQESQIAKNNADSIVVAEPSQFDAEKIGSIVTDYSVLEESGIGISIIIEMFEKETENVWGYITFFDIRSRELLYVYRSSGRASGMGMEVHWRTGLKDMWYDYIIKDYIFTKKKILKEQKKNKN